MAAGGLIGFVLFYLFGPKRKAPPMMARSMVQQWDGGRRSNEVTEFQLPEVSSGNQGLALSIMIQYRARPAIYSVEHPYTV